jgi:hypothetical protein
MRKVMLAMMGTAAILVSITMLIHYEVLRLVSDALPRLLLPRRLKILALMYVLFLCHTVEVWLYALALWSVTRWTNLGILETFEGDTVRHFADFLYYSAATYTSLGFGDLVPKGDVRLLAGVEALNGLVLIGWSASVTYLAMERLWPIHLTRNKEQ